jgi:phosphocarrier protein
LRRVDLFIANRLGLHGRAAGRFVQEASRFRARVTVIKGDSRVDGKSILGLLTLAASQGCQLCVTLDGEDEDEAAAALTALVHGRFGEGA